MRSLRALEESQRDRALPALEAASGTTFPISIPRKQRSLDDLRQLVVVQHGEKLVRLADVAEVRIDSEMPFFAFKSNGKLGLLIGATVKEGGNIAEACNEIRRLTIEASQAIDPDIDIDILVDPSDFIQEAIVNIGQAIISGVSIATLIIFLFLGSIRFTAIIAIAIPLSLIGGFIVMSATGIELNLISLGAMALSVRMVVDGCIVVLENIHRRLRETKPVTVRERLEVVTAAARHRGLRGTRSIDLPHSSGHPHCPLPPCPTDFRGSHRRTASVRRDAGGWGESKGGRADGDGS